MEQFERLDEIIANIKSIKGAQALIGIGTTGSDRERMDDYSDLDFFVIAEKDEKPDLLDQLDWLETPTASLVFSFKNTPDGYKVLYSDGIYVEFAIFTEKEYQEVPLACDKVLWSREEISLKGKHDPVRTNPDWYFNEAITNLYVAKMRVLRGEVISAHYYLDHAVDDIMTGITLSQESLHKESIDWANPARRFEKHFPAEAAVVDEIFANSTKVGIKLAFKLLENYIEINKELESLINDF